MTPSRLDGPGRWPHDRDGREALALLPWRGLLGLVGFPVLALLAASLANGEVAARAGAWAAAAAAAAVAAARSGWRLASRHRQAWLLIAVALVVWTLGQSLATLRPVGPSGPLRDIALANAGSLLAVPLLVAGLLTLVPPARDRGAGLRLALDAAIGLASLLTVTWIFVVQPALDPSFSLVAQGVVVARAGGGVVLVMATLLVGLWLGNRPMTPELGALAFGVVGFAVADALALIAWAEYRLRADAVAHGLGTAAAAAQGAWLAAFLLIGGAALLERRRGGLGEPTPGIGEAGTYEPLWRMVLPYPLALVLVTLVGWQELSGNLEGAGTWVLITSLTVVAVIIVRQGLTVRDARRLTLALSQQVDRDPLTGLFNHRKAHERIGRELEHGREWGHPLAVALIDVDDFKVVNDTHGHLVGDQVLRGLAGMLLQSCRGTDVAARYAGDEFLLILPGADLAAARTVNERILRHLRASQASRGGDDPAVSLSIGVAVTRHYVRTAEQLVAIADAAMYDAKEAGKNGAVVVDADTLVADPLVRSSDPIAHPAAGPGVAPTSGGLAPRALAP